MLKKKEQQKYLKKRIKKTLFHLHSFQAKPNMESLHQLRVEIKKIVALVHLSEDCLKRQYLKEHIKPLKKIFKQAALIRNAQINIQILEQERIAITKFKGKQEDVIFRESTLFLAQTDTYSKWIKKVKKSLLPELKKITNHQLRKWGATEFKEIKAGLESQQDDKFHTCRKKIKRLLYAHQLFETGINENCLKDLEETIGQWHDLIATIDVLKQDQLLTRKLSDTLISKQNELKIAIDKASKNFKEKALI